MSVYSAIFARLFEDPSHSIEAILDRILTKCKKRFRIEYVPRNLNLQKLGNMRYIPKNFLRLFNFS